MSNRSKLIQALSNANRLMSHPILKIVTNEGCQSYLIGCPATRDCLLVDPKVGSEAAYEALLGHYGLKLMGVLDTHTHADHLSAATRFSGEGTPLFMSAVTAVQRDMQALDHGQTIAVGQLNFEVIHVPGHTPDSIALYGHGMLISGDSLFIGGLARADFVGSDPEQLFDSVSTRLMCLPPDTLVFPGHGYNDILFSTIECEGRLNTGLVHSSGAAYAEALGVTSGAGNSAAVNANLELNLQANPALPASAGNAAACCASPGGDQGYTVDEVASSSALGIRDQLSSPERWIDVRDPFEYESGRISGVTNIPLSELGFHLDELTGPHPLYLSCRSGVRSMTAAKTLLRLGVAQNPVNIGGGILGWQDQGNSIEGVPAT